MNLLGSLSTLLFNGLSTYFLEIPVIIHWVLVAMNIYFYNYYYDGKFLISSLLLLLNLILLFYEDYKMFNGAIKNEISEAIIEQGNLGVMVFDQKGNIITLNQNFKKIFQNNSMDLQFENMQLFIQSLPEDISKKIEDNINLTMASNRITHGDIFVNNTDYQLSFEKLPHDQWLFMITCQVASMVNKAQINQIHDKTLSIYDNNTNLWQDMINQSDLGHLITDFDGKIININKKIIQLFNKSFTELKYASLNTIIDEKQAEVMMDFNVDKGILLFNLRSFLWQKEKINNYYWFSIREKNYEENTNDVVKNYQDEIIDQWPVGLIIFDDESLLYMNNTFKNLLDNFPLKTMDQWLETPLIATILKRWHPLKGDNFLDVNGDQWKPSVMKKTIEKIRIYPMVFQGVKVFNVVDISNYFTQEQQLLHAQRLMTTGEILSGVIHDLNNYLMPILGYAENVFTKINVYDPIYNNMIHLQNNAIRAANLVKYLLNMSRKNTDNSVIGNLNLKIAELLRSMAKVISKNIDIKFKQDQEVQGLAIGSVLLEQILTNLLINSRDAIVDKLENNPQEKGLIYITTELIPNHYPQKSETNGVKIRVFDNGKGIAPINLKKIFDPFYTTKNDKGMGLGLATVKKIIEANGGSIEVISQQDISTEIAIILPSLSLVTEEDKSPYITGNDSMMVDTGTILVVEDEQSIRRLLKEHLTKNGYTVVEAENAGEALKQMESMDTIDLLISDVMLPDMSIVAMVKAIQKKFPEIMIILSSGSTQDQVDEIIQESFNYTFLNKPFPLNQMLTTIKDLKG
jgi:signal transduction histidine kinase/CheY-like chemotaxis protein